ncbi:MAG: hypothetical protein WD904_05655 [Dehalococcoidia bacterium]
MRTAILAIVIPVSFTILALATLTPDGTPTTLATHSGDLDCGDFPNQKAAQDHMDAHPGDPDNLDGNDHDGLACETLPCPCSTGATPTPTNPPTPSPTKSPTQTPQPSATPYVWARLWGDIDCSNAVNPVDSLKLLRSDAGLLVSYQTPECPHIGVALPASAPNPTWGDIDCSGQVNPVDSLKTLRHDGGLSVDQNPGCPDVGSPT